MKNAMHIPWSCHSHLGVAFSSHLFAANYKSVAHQWLILDNLGSGVTCKISVGSLLDIIESKGLPFSMVH